MWAKERDGLKVLHAVQKRHITQVQAAKELGISARWVRVRLQRIRASGDGAVVHRLRGRPSNRGLPEATKRRVVELFLRQKQARQGHDYGPTLAAQELAEEHGIAVSRETPRQWLMAGGPWRAAGRGSSGCIPAEPTARRWICVESRNSSSPGTALDLLPPSRQNRARRVGHPVETPAEMMGHPARNHQCGQDQQSSPGYTCAPRSPSPPPHTRTADILRGMPAAVDPQGSRYGVISQMTPQLSAPPPCAVP